MELKYNKEILVKDYFDIHNFYSNIYGKKRTIIVMQVGSFHECYSTDVDGIDLVNLAVQLDVVCTKKNSKELLSKSNPRMLGFPIYVTDNFIERLCNLNFTVVKIDQTTDPPKPKREVVGIYSPATFVEKLNNLSNFIVSIVIDKIKNNLLCIGLSSYDLSTGYGSYYETYSTSSNLMLALDDANRYLETCPPKEIILFTTLEEEDKINNMTFKHILGYLNLDEKILFYNKNNNNNKISFQKILFEKIFPNNKNIFESLNLHLYNWARFSLTNLYDYVEKHQINLLNRIKLPTEFNNNSYLYLGNHCLEQLNVFNKNTSEKSLFQIINVTKTLLGKRFLIDTLSKPLIDITDLNIRYQLIDKIITNNYCDSISNLLEDISDIDKLVRRSELGTIHPSELYLLYLSIYQINKLSIFCNKNNLFNLDNKYVVNDLLNHMDSTFNLDLICSLNFNNFTEYDNNIFKKKKYSDIDELLEEYTSSLNFLDNLIIKLSVYIDDKKKNDLITLKYNERDGHYLLLTNRRCEILKKNLNKINFIEIGKHKLKITDFDFIELPRSAYTKINCLKIKEISNELVVQKTRIAKLIKEKFKLEVNYILDTFNEILLYWGKKIGFIDFINSGAIIAIKNHYSKPEIIYHEDSYFSGKNIRHPIIEFISNEYEYKPHDLSLGGSNELSGILLYGINSSGKSTLMKSVGLNIILAQIGYFVSAEKFIYSPYHSLFTRICGNDNIYRGLSSFMVEMIELTSILKRNNSKTLVIGDEICRGTETASANIIVAYMIKTLSEKNTTFITATHLHELVNLETIKKLQNVKAKHIKLSYDDINDELIYDRILSDGSGPNFYGLQVAKYLMKDTLFNDVTSNILDEYNNVSIKQSKYNSDIYMVECKICNSKENLESHHIEFQKDFDSKKIHKKKLHYQKDASYNLVTLCSKCHDEIDRSKIIINGWKETTNGKDLDYYFNNKVDKKPKYDKELIDYIKNLKLENVDIKFAKIKIKEQFNKRLTDKTIINLWS